MGQFGFSRKQMSRQSQKSERDLFGEKPVKDKGKREQEWAGKAFRDKAGLILGKEEREGCLCRRSLRWQHNSEKVFTSSVGISGAQTASRGVLH